MFLKENRGGLMNGRGVANGRKEREIIKPKDATSPTVSTEAVMIMATIDALEGRDVVVVYIPGASFCADMYNEVHIVFRGALTDIMVRPIQHYTGHLCSMRQERRSYMSGCRRNFMAVLKENCCFTRS